jgi:transposase
MPRRTEIAPYLTLAELERRYRRAKDPVERSRWHILWLLARGHRQTEVSEVTGYSRRWICELVKRYNREGTGSLADRRHSNPGAPSLLSPEQQHELRKALRGPAPGGGEWDSRAVAAWISARTGRNVDIKRGWHYLRRLGTARRHRPLRDPPAPGDTGAKASAPYDLPSPRTVARRYRSASE